MTIAFDHRDTGTPEAAWQPLLRAAARVTLPDLPVLVVAAHPDDETLGAGGLIHRAGVAGRAVRILVASDGEASHPRSSTHTPARLAARRRKEVTAAVAELAPGATVCFLGLPDGGLDGHEPQLVSAVAAELAGPALVVAPWRADGHPDHAATARAAQTACAGRPDTVLWQYPIWAWHWGDPARPAFDPLGRLDLDAAELRAKDAALARYTSQHHDLSGLPGDEAILSGAVLAHFRRDTEAFVLPDTGRQPEAPATATGYFDALYAGSDDPWGLGERWYEIRKRRLVLASLPRPAFRAAFEPGCATGLLTAGLATRCDTVLAWDPARRAAELARARLTGTPGVRVEHRRVPEQWPRGRFDLVVLSEVGYYCRDLAALARRVRSGLAADGVVLACHWRHPAPDHAHGAEAVHAALGAGLFRLVHHLEPDFLLDVWSRDMTSVARSEGIVA